MRYSSAVVWLSVQVACSASEHRGVPQGQSDLEDVEPAADQDTAAHADEDPCAMVGCGPPPDCGAPCSARCGCCRCAEQEDACVDAASLVRCNAAQGCYEREACGEEHVCLQRASGPECVRTFEVGGTLSGASGPVELSLAFGPAYDPLKLAVADNGAFSFPRQVPDGSRFSFWIESRPAGQACFIEPGCRGPRSFSSSCGTISGEGSAGLKVTCYQASPCELWSPSRACSPSSDGCPGKLDGPYWCADFDASCAVDGSPTPDMLCCNTCE
jgi:hypothetical protein